MEKENQIVGIRAIIEAIQSGATVDKVYIQKEASGELMKDLMNYNTCKLKQHWLVGVDQVYVNCFLATSAFKFNLLFD
jgi:hypothetical protein